MRDRHTGKLVLFHVLPDGTFAVETRQDVEPIFDDNARIRNAQPSGWKGDTHLVARMDMTQWQKLRTEGRFQEKRDLHAWLNDPAQSKLRTKTGKL